MSTPLSSKRVFINLSVHKVMSRYRQVSNIRRTKSQHLKDSCTVLRLQRTGDAPTTSERSTIVLPNKVPLILEVLRYSFPLLSIAATIITIKSMQIMKPLWSISLAIFPHVHMDFREHVYNGTACPKIIFNMLVSYQQLMYGSRHYYRYPPLLKQHLLFIRYEVMLVIKSHW